MTVGPRRGVCGWPILHSLGATWVRFGTPITVRSTNGEQPMPKMAQKVETMERIQFTGERIPR